MFPGIGLAASVAGTKILTDKMFYKVGARRHMHGASALCECTVLIPIGYLIWVRVKVRVSVRWLSVGVAQCQGGTSDMV